MKDPGQQQDQISTDQKKPEAKDETKPEAKTEGKEGTSLLTKDDKADAKKEEKPAEGAPEKYEEFKAPEGFELDKEALEKASTVFKELGLNQAQAQKLVDHYGTLSKEAAEAPFKAWAELNEGWQKEVFADKEIGTGTNVKPEVKLAISRALDGLGDPALAQSFKETMDLTGAGNHPAFVKAFYRLAQQVNEGKHVAGNRPSEHGQSATGSKEKVTGAQAIWGSLKP